MYQFEGFSRVIIDSQLADEQEISLATLNRLGDGSAALKHQVKVAAPVEVLKTYIENDVLHEAIEQLREVHLYNLAQDDLNIVLVLDQSFLEPSHVSDQKLNIRTHQRLVLLPPVVWHQQ